MLYNGIKPLQIYSGQEHVPLPKGDKTGFGNAVFMLSSSRIKSREILSKDFLSYAASFFKHYYIDFIYNEKIGRRKIVVNNTAVFKKEFGETNFFSTIRMVLPSAKKNLLKNDPNLFIDLGEWNNLYFQNNLKISQAKICKDYISFISQKINSPDYTNYNKLIYIDINDWIIQNANVFGFDKKYLNNPISIILLSIYKYEDILKMLGPVTIMLVDSTNRQFIKIDYSSFKKESYNKLKSKVVSMQGIKEKVSSTLDNEESTSLDDNDSIIADSLSTDKDNPAVQARKRILDALKQNLMGKDVEDITSEFDFGDDSSVDAMSVDSEYDDEIDQVANKYIDDNPDILTVDPEYAAKEIQKEVINKVYISKFMPERSLAETEKINKLLGLQNEAIGLPSYEDLESKIIDTSDLGDTMVTSNPDIVVSRFKNFDNNYNTKKLEKDIDSSVSILSKASSKIFVVGKSEEDTSDQLNLKRTLTYDLQDEKGRKMKVKFDVPIIIDDKFVYLNGNKKILQHQLVLKPLVKTSPDAVQVVTFYNKVFITRRNQDDLISSSIRKYLLTNAERFNVKLGNATVKNKDVETPIEFDIVAKRIYEFTINNIRFIMDTHELMSTLDSLKINYKRINLNENLLLGYNTETHEVIYMNNKNQIYSEVIMNFIPEEDKKKVKNTKVSRLMYSQCTMMDKNTPIPLILFLLFCEGFTSVMKKANIEYKFVTRKEAKDYDFSEYGKMELSDGIVVWKRYPLQNSLLLNGLQVLPTKLYSFEELDSKETYVFMLSQFFSYANMAFNFEQYRDFMIDDVSREILMDFNLPTDLVSLLLYANAWLKDNSYRPENDHNNIRIRSNELIPYFAYKAITNAYNGYRKTQHKAKPKPISLRGDEVIKAINESQLTENSSVLNVVLELEKNRAVTYKGKMGINLEQAMSLDKRAYDPSMLGILGISTPDDSGVGVLRQLTLEPNVTSTRGYLEVTPKEEVNSLNSANLLTPSELLTPMAVQHDDPTRTAMTYKQSKYMLPVKDATPVLIGNRVESVIPYHLSREFSIVAKDDGEVIAIEQGYVIIKYKNGAYDSIDITPQVKKNSAAGFFIETKMICEKKVGDKVKKDEVLAYNDKSFSRNKNDNSVSMNLGVLTKIAVTPNWDIFEDSAPITKKLSEKLASVIINEKEVALERSTYVERMVSIGDEVKTGDPLIVFDSFPDDPDAAKFLESLREDLKEEIIESTVTTIKSKYTGVIADIKIYSTVDIEDLSPSLQKIVKAHYTKLSKRENVLEKYKNEDDSKYYKCGQLVTESPVKLVPDYQGKIKGSTVGEGVLIVFYIKYVDIAATGDKDVALAALKSIISHVIDPGYEPYSEFEPDEEISTFVSPLSISARKTPSIFFNMFGNKMLIYLKRQLKEKYLNE